MTALQNHQESVNQVERWEPAFDGALCLAATYLLGKMFKKMTPKQSLALGTVNFVMLQLFKPKQDPLHSHNKRNALVKCMISAQGTVLTYVIFQFASSFSQFISSPALKNQPLTKFLDYPFPSLPSSIIFYVGAKVVVVAAIYFKQNYDNNFSLPNIVNENNWENLPPKDQLQRLMDIEFDNKGGLRVMNDGTIDVAWIEGLNLEEFSHYFSHYSDQVSMLNPSMEHYKQKQPCSDSEVLDAVCTRAAQDGLLTKDNYEGHPCYKVASTTAQGATRAHFENG